MSGLICPHCDQVIDVFKTGGGRKLAAEMGVPFLGRVPLDPQIVRSGDAGRPFVQASADSPSAEAFASIVAPILNGHAQTAPPTHQDSRKDKTIMKIAIPTADGRLCMHFGHCQQFAMVDVDPASKSILATSYLTPPAHEPGVLPRWLHAQGANVIIAGGMGQRAQGLFSQNGIKVIVGAPAEKPEDVASAYLAGTLEVGQNVCDH